jgi:molybdenum cofactor synthesis domain-containing protein
MADESGPAVHRILTAAGFEVSDVAVVPDEQDRIASFLVAAAENHALVVTTGGTGIGLRDVTPQATRPLLDYEVPGLAEQMRAEGMRKTPMAALSRSLAGVRGRTLILNLPGSVRGATESLDAVVPVLKHAVALLAGQTSHSGRPVHFQSAMLDVGQQAPDLKLPSSGGEDIRLSEAFARHRATILAFYVLDFTPG